MVEGDLRCEELSHYLENVGAPKVVWLSEDATAITPIINYDPVTDELVGLVLPTDGLTRCPILHSFEAKTANDIKEHMKKKKSTIMYAVMAQTIDERYPPFILQLYGSDNTFEAKDVLNRWQHTEKELAKYGIKIAGFSSDVDARLMTIMCHRTLFESCEAQTIQDTVHICTKFRNRLLNTVISLRMGTHKVSIEHLNMLIRKVPKDVHGLTLTDVCPNDRQNFKSFEKITTQRVFDALE